MDIIKYKSIFLGASVLMVAFAAYAIFSFGFHFGIDFTGGSMWQLKIKEANSEQIKDFFMKDLQIEVSNISFDSKSGAYSISFKEISDAERQLNLAKLKAKFTGGVEDQDFLAISPSVSDEIKQKAMLAIAFVMFGISLYIAFVFRKVSRPISSWKYGIITLITLIHDVVIPAGVFAILSKYLGVSLDSNFIVALLVVMGFSVHDTIVVFDRIRENLLKTRNKNLQEIVNASVNETLRRSINTSLTIIIVMAALYFLGPANLKFFILTMLIGTTVGTYSSIFVASPLLVVFQKLFGSR